MRLPGRGPSDLVELLFAVHRAGCSSDSLAKLAAGVQSAGDFSGVLIALGEAGSARTGRSGSRGALRVLDGRLAEPGPPADTGTARSWPITDPAGTELGRLRCLLGANAAPPAGELQATIELVCGQLGVAGAAAAAGTAGSAPASRRCWPSRPSGGWPSGPMT